MSLVDEMMEPCVLMERTRVSDGEGGFVTTWKDGAEFQCAITLNSTMEARIAESQGVTSVYNITTKKNTILEYHDVIKRLSDGQTFRITSNGNDKVTIESSTLNLSRCTAEKWSIPND